MNAQFSAGEAPQISATLVTRLIRAQFPQWVGLAVRPVEHGGWDNRTFHLGKRMIVRLPSAERYVAQVQKEQHWLPRLAPQLPLPIPSPLALGQPGEGYPWPWSVYAWINGETARSAKISDQVTLAMSLAGFLAVLHRIDSTGGPAPGPHNFYRGGSLAVYDGETRTALAALTGTIDVEAAAAMWRAALATTWNTVPVWVHGDMASGNLLVERGRLSAVIDFGSCGVGDPACDLSIAWTFFSGSSRAAFRAGLPLDSATWARARGWTLWKTLIVAAGLPGANPLEAQESRRLIADLIADHRLAETNG